jgi:hypothetical protein
MVPPNRDHLERELLARAIRRYASGRKNTDAKRLLGVAGRVLEGLSFAVTTSTWNSSSTDSRDAAEPHH